MKSCEKNSSFATREYCDLKSHWLVYGVFGVADLIYAIIFTIALRFIQIYAIHSRDAPGPLSAGARNRPQTWSKQDVLKLGMFRMLILFWKNADADVHLNIRSGCGYFYIACFLYKSRFFVNDFSSFFSSACLPFFFAAKIEKKMKISLIL